MKKSGLLAASVAVASATAASASSSTTLVCNSQIRSLSQEPGSNRNQEGPSSRGSAANDQFAPKFDGLRFIETLVTAHR